MFRSYARSSEFHHRHPPASTASAATVVRPIALRARLRRDSGGVSPGASEPSRTAAPTIVTSPAKRKIPIAASPAPVGLSSLSREYATTTTGTTTCPLPLLPLTLTVTLLDPPLMIQSLPRKRPGSPSTGDAGSGGGAPPVASNLLACTVTRSGGSPTALTKTFATPGTTPAGSICTVIRYGPADPSNHVSGLPTCALASRYRQVMPAVRMTARITAECATCPFPSQVQGAPRQSQSRPQSPSGPQTRWDPSVRNYPCRGSSTGIATDRVGSSSPTDRRRRKSCAQTVTA